MMQFVRTFSIMRAYCLRHKAYCYGKGSKLWKNCIHQKHVGKWLVWGMHPHISPGSAPARTDNNVSHHTPTSRFCFSMMRGQFCHSCIEITARTALAQFGHFILKTRVQF